MSYLVKKMMGIATLADDVEWLTTRTVITYNKVLGLIDEMGFADKEHKSKSKKMLSEQLDSFKVQLAAESDLATKKSMLKSFNAKLSDIALNTNAINESYLKTIRA